MKKLFKNLGSQRYSGMLRDTQRYSKILKDTQRYSKIFKDSQRFLKIWEDSAMRWPAPHGCSSQIWKARYQAKALRTPQIAENARITFTANIAAFSLVKAVY